MSRQSTKLWVTFLAWLTNGEISEEESERKFEEMLKEYDNKRTYRDNRRE